MKRNHFQNAPEALLGRNDSKNPATTCRGITSSGRPCRRALAASKGSHLWSRDPAIEGVVALVEEDGHVTDARFYCWQHKDQAGQNINDVEEVEEMVGRRPAKRQTEFLQLKNRSSIDTLVQRLGIQATMSDSGGENQGSNERPARQPRPPRKTEGRDFAPKSSHATRVGRPVRNTIQVQQKPRAKQERGFWNSLCCMRASDDDDFIEIVRHRRRVEAPKSPMVAKIPDGASSSSQASKPHPGSLPRRQPATSDLQAPPGSGTGQLLSKIPSGTSPRTASALLAELSRPPNPNDEEGYIYIFWLTPTSKPTPAESTARSLLSPESARPRPGRRMSDVMTDYSYSGSERGKSTDEKAKTVLLKIGRANNVTRRMNEWQRQCGYELNLVRWYPYIPSCATPSPHPSPSREVRQQPLYPDLSRHSQANVSKSEVVRKVPGVKRVERLIHLELSDKQAKRQCDACGREHREWFETSASQKGVKEIDEVVRRWVDWSEREHSGIGS